MTTPKLKNNLLFRPQFQRPVFSNFILVSTQQCNHPIIKTAFFRLNGDPVFSLFFFYCKKVCKWFMDFQTKHEQFHVMFPKCFDCQDGFDDFLGDLMFHM